MKKVLVVVFLILIFLCGCEKRELGTLYSSNNKLEFLDSDGYRLILNYDNEDLISAEWIIVTNSVEDAEKLNNYYKDKTDTFSVEVDDKTVILTYSEKYTDEMFGSVSKSNMEKYMKQKGYTLVTE